MKPVMDDFAVVTATLDPVRAQACLQSWRDTAAMDPHVYVVWSALDPAEETRQVRDAGWAALKASVGGRMTVVSLSDGGVVPAFAAGVKEAFGLGAKAVLALHDDLLIEQDDWDLRVRERLQAGDKFGGFGGAISLGAADIYQTTYDPMQLARGGFRSNMREAEAHGVRTVAYEDCCVFDGFSQLGTADWFGAAWKWLGESGIQHHAYDAALGCLAARAKVQPGRLIPITCHHLGGQTAVGSQAYQAWANAKVEGGDQTFWKAAHQIVYQEFRDVLPLRV